MVSTAHKIVKAGPLSVLSAKLRARGKRVVFTNGCFDLLHVGHVTLLEKARSLGDCLIVGLNTDASTRGLKGPGRPVVSEKDRARVMAALECVDYVTLFNEPTPAQLIQKLKPTILVKGGDYSLDQIVGRDQVSKVVRIPLVKGRSTSSLIEKVLTAYGRKPS